MTDTPIVDAACWRENNSLVSEVVLAETARNLERMCKQLIDAAEVHCFLKSTKPVSELRDAIAKWNAMQP